MTCEMIKHVEMRHGKDIVRMRHGGGNSCDEWTQLQGIYPVGKHRYNNGGDDA
jgi:hypothetical protein